MWPARSISEHLRVPHAEDSTLPPQVICFLTGQGTCPALTPSHLKLGAMKATGSRNLLSWDSDSWAFGGGGGGGPLNLHQLKGSQGHNIMWSCSQRWSGRRDITSGNPGVGEVDGERPLWTWTQSCHPLSLWLCDLSQLPGPKSPR